jgi:hypothetical protein
MCRVASGADMHTLQYMRVLANEKPQYVIMTLFNFIKYVDRRAHRLRRTPHPARTLLIGAEDRSFLAVVSSSWLRTPL